MNSVRPSDDQLPRAGDVIAGKYRIDSVIGKGGMGVVLGAEDTSLGRRVAIKFLTPGKARDPSAAAARFAREARAAASVQGEHVVRVFEVGALPNGASYIVMEHLLGGDLAQLLGARGPLPIDEAVGYLLEACEAIGEAHKLGIVHRDLKPQNLFLAQTPDGSSCVKVLDFGISKAIDEEAPNLTATNTVMGTPLYMSPEQVRSLKDVDLRSDIWALGAILFELITAAPIFEAASTTALCAMIAMDAPSSLRAKRPGAPPELEAVILRCLHKDPSGRFSDVAALADALVPFASEQGRASAARVARVVRGSHAVGHDQAWGSLAPAYATTTSGGGGASTSQSSYLPPPGASGHGVMPGYPSQQPSNYPPGAIPAPGYTGYVQHANMPPQGAQQRSTHDAWQHQTGATGPGAIEPRRSSSALGAILGGVAGLLVLAMVGGAGVYFVGKGSSDGAAQAKADAAAVVAEAPPLPTAAPATSVAVAAGAAGAPGPSKKSSAPAAAPKDAGAVPGALPPGTVAPQSSDAAEAERLARLKQIAQSRCSAQAALFKGTDPDAARRVKGFTCPAAVSHGQNSGSSNCDRANCRRACTILNEKSCLTQLDSAERGNPLPF